MKHQSLKTAKRAREARPVRDQLKADVRRCEYCLRQREPHLLAGHEIARGSHRQKALDKRFALLVVCLEPDWRRQIVCHRIVQDESEVRQLARLMLVRPADYNLPAYLELTSPRAPNRITQDEVNAAAEELLAASPSLPSQRSPQ